MSEPLICQKIFSVRTNWSVEMVLELEVLADEQFTSRINVLAAPEQCMLFEVGSMEHHWSRCCWYPRDTDCIASLA